MFEKAKWTAYPFFEAPLVIKKFTAKAGNAILAVCGLGWYEVYLNGIRVNEGMFFQPAQSDYHERSLKALLYPVTGTFSHRIYYNVFDVGEYVRDGENELRFLLGNGWYRQRVRRCEGDTSYSDSLKLLFELTLSDGGRVFSDGTLVYRDSCIRENSLYTGETRDMRFRTDREERAEEIPSPDSCLLLQTCPPDEIYDTRPCRPIGNGKYDAGINGAGRLKFVAECDSERIVVRYAEELYPDGTLDFSTTALGTSQIQKDEYRNVAKGQTLTTSFTWHGFRYVEIEGAERVKNVRAEYIATRLALTGFFESDEPMLNWLYETAVHTIRSNVHGGVPSDCPHRERLGYTADGQLAAETALWLFDAEKLYLKWLGDILDGQESDGHIQHTAPFEGGGGGPAGWGGAVVLLPYKLYLMTGGLSAAKEAFSAMESWCRFTVSALENGLICSERAGGWCLGEWCAPAELCLEEPFVNTCLFVRILDFFEELCALLKRKFLFSDTRRICREGILSRYYDSSKDCFGGGRQGADLFAFAAGLGSEKAKRRAERYYQTHPVDTGIFGTELLFDFLAERKREDVIFKLFTDKDYPSYGYMRERGATTFWETWRGDNAVSHNHPMFSSPVKHLFVSFLGIKPIPAKKQVLIFPRYAGVRKCRGKVRLFGQEIEVEEEFADGRLIRVSVVLPIPAEGVSVEIKIGRKTHSVKKSFFWNITDTSAEKNQGIKSNLFGTGKIF